MRKRANLQRRHGIRFDNDSTSIRNWKSYDRYREREFALENRFRDSPEFHALRKKLHVEPFYCFLRLAGKKAVVLVIKGDHDDDFHGDYDTRRINRIRGCEEISGKIATVKGVKFIGLGYDDCHSLRTLRSLVDRYSGGVNVVLAHAKQARVPFLANFKSRVIIRGHFGHGRFFVNGIPAVFTAGLSHCLIKFGRTVEMKPFRGTKLCRTANCTPWGSRKKDIEIYPWLEPYSKRRV